MKVAIIHYWLDGYRGGEKVIEALCELFPDADIYTHIFKADKIPGTIKKHNIYTTFIQRLPFSEKFSRAYIPLMPVALKFLNLRKYDLIISSESGPAKGIRKRPDAVHICYCHTPMRYIWDMEKLYVAGSSLVVRGLWSIAAHFLRKWDYRSAQGVDFFIANSRFVAARIRKFYKRSSTVINPPVNVEEFSPSRPRGNFYLVVSQLVPYKRVDLVVEAFNNLKLPLVVIGDGTEMGKIMSMAKDNISLLGKVSDDILKEKMETCRAFVFAGKEDFGLIFVEAQAAGAPVLAYGRGGVKDIVANARTGCFFHRQTADSIIKCVKDFESERHGLLSSVEISERTRRFSRQIFNEKIAEFIKHRSPDACGSNMRFYEQNL